MVCFLGAAFFLAAGFALDLDFAALGIVLVLCVCVDEYQCVGIASGEN